MICSDDGYSLTYFPKRNTIEIVMPQTMTTLTNTVAMTNLKMKKVSRNDCL